MKNDKEPRARPRKSELSEKMGAKKCGERTARTSAIKDSLRTRKVHLGRDIFKERDQESSPREAGRDDGGIPAQNSQASRCTITRLMKKMSE